MMNVTRYGDDNAGWGPNNWNAPMQTQSLSNPMMSTQAVQLHYVLSVATWILILAVLVAVFRFIWKKGSK